MSKFGTELDFDWLRCIEGDAGADGENVEAMEMVLLLAPGSGAKFAKGMTLYGEATTEILPLRLVIGVITSEVVDPRLIGFGSVVISLLGSLL